MVCVIALASTVAADNIRGIEMEFVTIGSPGNAGDTRPAANPLGCGAVSYEYRIGRYEVTNAQWNTFTAAAGAPTGNKEAYYAGEQMPTTCVSWYEAAQFCNYLTSGDKSAGVYQFSGNNTNPGNFLGVDRDAARATYGAIYFLPTDDEWYKAAYFSGGYTPHYSLYARGTDTAPQAAVETNYLNSVPWNVGTGTVEQNGTYDMMGNVWEWNETLGGSGRCLRGGSYACHSNVGLPSSYWYGSSSGPGQTPTDEATDVSFRVGSIVPEPATMGLLGLGLAALAARRKRE